MNITDTPVHEIPPIARREALGLATEEHRRVLELLRSLRADDWGKPTECTGWDVRAMAGHMLGMMEFPCTLREFIHTLRSGAKVAGSRPLIDGMTELQVTERAHLTVEELLERIAVAGPRAARARNRLPAPLRRLPMKQKIDGVAETWTLRYLFDVILTRDPWTHRGDISRATGRELMLTADHDGRLVADVVAEWARRHGAPFRLTLTGQAGGVFTKGSGGEEIEIDAVQFCRILSGRAVGSGLLSQQVPF